MFRLIEPSSVQNTKHNTGTSRTGSHNVCTRWIYQYYDLYFGLMMAQWAETCRRILIFNIDYQYMLFLLTD